MNIFSGMNFFGAPSVQKIDPTEQAKKWRKELAKEQRKLERDIAHLGTEEKKSMNEIKKLVKSNNVNAAKILAKEVANCRKTTERMHLAKSQLNSVSMEIQANISMIKVQGAIAKSSAVMKSMNQLVSIPELAQSMTAMAREMERVGLIEEMMNDSFAMMDDEGVDTAANAEVDRILQEITAGQLRSAPEAPVIKPDAEAAVVCDETAQNEADYELSEMQKRLAAL